MNSEEIIAALTAKNLDLEEQNKIEQPRVGAATPNGRGTRKSLKRKRRPRREELQLLMSEEQMIATATLKRQLLDWENRAVDYERAIVKFRQKMADLNEELQNARDELATMRAREEEKARAAGTEISLLTNANRALSEIVEAELNAIELKFAKQHLGNLRNFLPDNFTKAEDDDNDCLIPVRPAVPFPRLSAKNTQGSTPSIALLLLLLNCAREPGAVLPGATIGVKIRPAERLVDDSPPVPGRTAPKGQHRSQGTLRFNQQQHILGGREEKKMKKKKKKIKNEEEKKNQQMKKKKRKSDLLNFE